MYKIHRFNVQNPRTQLILSQKSMDFQICICGFLSQNPQITLESADFNEIGSYLSDRETSERNTICLER